MNNLAAGTLLAILPTKTATIQRMPWVMDLDFLPDMGRMTMRLSLARNYLFAGSDAAASGRLNLQSGRHGPC